MFISNNPTTFNTQVTITRPSDTTAYTAGDAVGDTGGSAILTFGNMAPRNGAVYITDANLRINVSSVPSGMSTFRLHLYNAAPDAIADNAAWDLSSSGDRGKYLGYIDIATPADLGSTLYSQNAQVNKTIKVAPDTNAIYGVLQTIGAYTPTSAAVKVVELVGVAS